MACQRALLAVVSLSVVVARLPTAWPSRRAASSGGGCVGLIEDGIVWDVVRTDLTHVLQLILEGALSRDLHAAKDSAGRDPAVSYGDVQLQRHLERFQQLAKLLESRRDVKCELGRQAVLLLVSSVYSGLQWPTWFRKYEAELVGVIHEANWTEALGAGWPILGTIALIAEMHGGSDVPESCENNKFDTVLALTDEGKEVRPADIGTPTNCTFGEALAVLASAASAAAAAAKVARFASAGSQRLHSSFSLVRPVQLAVRDAVQDELGVASSPLFAFPMPALLSRLANSLKAMQAKHAATSQVDIIYCGHAHVDDDELRAVCAGRQCDLHRLQTESLEESLKVCYAFYRKSLQSMRERAQAQKGMQTSTFLISPLLWQWREEVTHDLRQLLKEQSVWRREVAWAGLGAMNSSKLYNWPVQRLRHQYWKLDYSDYATGHETSPYMPLAQFWAVGDTTSGTRIYDTRVLLELEDSILRAERGHPAALPLSSEPLGEPSSAAEWFVALDLAAKAQGLRAYTLLAGQVLEDSYRSHVALSSRLSRSFHVEAARFLPGAAQQHNCLFPTSKTAAAFTSDHGTVVSWCTRWRLKRMFQVIGNWWLQLAPGKHIIVPVSASVLNIYRSGDLELFPWDADIDANFISQNPLVIGSLLEEHQDQLASMGYDYILKGDRVVFKDIHDTARMDIWISGPQDVIAYEIRARLCGVRVNFFRDQLEGTVWYYRPAEKIFGNTRGMLLHCRWPGHNACLPDCVRDGLGVGPDGCEFPDRFVHLDV
eukprot:TRINITY_DN11895_c0_g1_i4.p1 TRINITY_DN11895_c0_g1~~TRINITY_DN11895_c0_g1_i4.p1  ORF type:complete len:770 (+),score=163.17 TRINITY_DN11895_c0_g1_i4:83-2392(+)